MQDRVERELPWKQPLSAGETRLSWEAAPRVKASAFGRTLTLLVQRFPPTSRTIEVREVKGKRPGAAALPRLGRGWRIDVPVAIVDAPAELQSFIAAHEYAHIQLAHQPWRDELIAMAARVGLIAVGMAAMIDLRDSTGLFLLPVVFLWSLIAALLAGQWVSAVLRRPLEIAADKQAAQWGYPLTVPIAARLAAAEPAVTQHRWFAPFRTHPDTAARLSHTSGASS